MLDSKSKNKKTIPLVFFGEDEKLCYLAELSLGYFDDKYNRNEKHATILSSSIHTFLINFECIALRNPSTVRGYKGEKN